MAQDPPYHKCGGFFQPTPPDWLIRPPGDRLPPSTVAPTGSEMKSPAVAGGAFVFQARGPTLPPLGDELVGDQLCPRLQCRQSQMGQKQTFCDTQLWNRTRNTSRKHHYAAPIQ